jgi:nonribosomal peptide synthetase DhbF
MVPATSLTSAVAAWASRTPDAAALVAEAERMTYAELWRESLTLAQELTEHRFEPHEVVALALPPSCAAVVALLAVHLAGGAFLFLDAAAPEARQRAMLGLLGVRCVIARPGSSPLGCQPLAVDARGRCVEAGVARHHQPAPLPGDPAPDDLAYVVATSGSSGRPKLVRIAHRGIMPLLAAQVATFAIERGKRVLLGTPLCFDASLSDIGTALAAGATLCIPPEREDPDRLRSFMLRERVTHADLPPALVAGLGDPPAALETLVVGGEVVAAPLLRRWAARVRVVVCYGPSEATVCTSMAEVDATRWDEPCIGEPLGDTRYRLVEGGEVVLGAGSGELWIAGSGLALGYVADPELEAARFVEHDGTRWYRSGDRVTRRDGGVLVFAGRLDRQRKLGGKIFCPEESEGLLGKQPEVLEVAVVPRAVIRRGLAPRVTPIAHLRLRRDASPLETTRRLAAVLATSLPAGLVPRLEVVATLPRTASGKIDCRRLESEPLTAPPFPGDEVCAHGEADLVARILSQVLGVAALTIDDDFVALGGDSLAALEVVAQAELWGLPLASDAVMIGRSARRIAAAARAPLSTAAIVDRCAGELARAAALMAPPGEPRPSPHVVLFTGATGFFGSRLVAQWLADGDGIARCLIRAASAGQARQRLERAFAHHRLACPGWQRIEVVVGDCAAPRLGMDEARYRAQADEVDAIVHAAADVSLAAGFGELVRPNVESLVALLELAAEGRPKHLHAISSLAALLAAADCPRSVDESFAGAELGALEGGYAGSKWAAEALTRELTPELGARVAVHRLGLLLARGGPTPRASSFCAVIRGLAAIGAVPAGDHAALTFDATPVDRAASVVAALVRRGALGARWHVASRGDASLAELLAALDAEGVAVETVGHERFLTLVRERGSASRDAAHTVLALAQRLAGRLRRRDHDLFLTSDRRIGVARTEAASGIGIAAPTRADLRDYIRWALAAPSCGSFDPAAGEETP